MLREHQWCNWRRQARPTLRGEWRLHHAETDRNVSIRQPGTARNDRTAANHRSGPMATKGVTRPAASCLAEYGIQERSRSRSPAGDVGGRGIRVSNRRTPRIQWHQRRSRRHPRPRRARSRSPRYHKYRDREHLQRLTGRRTDGSAGPSTHGRPPIPSRTRGATSWPHGSPRSGSPEGPIAGEARTLPRAASALRAYWMNTRTLSRPQYSSGNGCRFVAAIRNMTVAAVWSTSNTSR